MTLFALPALKDTDKCCIGCNKTAGVILMRLLQVDMNISSNRGDLQNSSLKIGMVVDHTNSSTPGSGSESLNSPSRGALADSTAEEVEGQILARIAAVCQPGMYHKARSAQVILPH